MISEQQQFDAEISCGWIYWNQVQYHHSQRFTNSIWIKFTFSEHVIDVVYGSFEICTAPMVSLVMYKFKIENIDEITPKEYFTDAYVEEFYEQNNVRTFTKLFRITLDARY